MRKKGRLTRDDWERIHANTRRLRERIDYHRRKLIEERPGWTAPATDDEWEAYHRARIEAHPP